MVFFLLFLSLEIKIDNNVILYTNHAALKLFNRGLSDILGEEVGKFFDLDYLLERGSNELVEVEINKESHGDKRREH